MNYRKHYALRYIAATVASYLLSLFLLLFITCLILIRTIFSPYYMIGAVDRGGFTMLALSEMQEIYISHGMASGIPEDVMLSVLTHRHVDDAIKTSMYAAYQKSRAYDFDRYEDEIYDALHAFASEMDGAIASDEPVTSSTADRTANTKDSNEHDAVSDDLDTAQDVFYSSQNELNTALRDLAELCVNDFKLHIISPAIALIGDMALRHSRFAFMVTFLIALLTAATAALIPLLRRRRSSRAGAYAQALAAAGIICAAIPAYVRYSGLTRQLSISPPSYNRLLSAWIGGIADGYLIALIPVLLLLAACLATWTIYRRK